MPYFNYSVHPVHAAAASFWQRRAFLNAWWSLYQDDSRWTPPDYQRTRRELDPRHNEHLARLEATLIHIDALHRTGLRRSRTDQQEIPLTSILERTLAAAASIIDGRRKGKTGHLALAHFGSDKEAFDTLYYHLVETLSAAGFHRLVGPVGLSPHLGSGLQVDGWDEWPPAHTPANPPYAPELVEARLTPLQDGRLYRAAVPARPPEPLPDPARIASFDPARLAGDLRPLLVAAVDNPTAGFPPPDAAEAAFLLRSLGTGRVTGFLAEMDGEPAGFVLVGPDRAGWLRATRGGRSLWRQARYGVEARLWPGRRLAGGQIFFGAVLPGWRRQGIGAQLWQQATGHASRMGWASLAVGPVWLPKGSDSAAVAFLEARSATARQSYRLYERSF